MTARGLLPGLALALAAAGCGDPLMRSTTMPPKPHAPTGSALVIGVAPSEVRTESETPADLPRTEAGSAPQADTRRTNA